MSDYICIEPNRIEEKSFEIIGELLASQGIKLCEQIEPIVKRVIHTTADFSYVDTLRFSKAAVSRAIELIKSGATIVTDTNMALSGINKSRISRFGCNVRCFMADEDIAKRAKELSVTRASVAMMEAKNISGPVIFAIGNAPTALIELDRLMKSEGFKPDFIIGVPVGFVNVEYAKELILSSDCDYIVNEGRKGGSNVAAAIVNALVLMAMRDADA